MERALRRLEKAFAEEAGVLAREKGVSGIVLLSVILKLMRNGLTTIRNTQNEENILQLRPLATATINTTTIIQMFQIRKASDLI
jgi:hypothetical protein